MKYFFVLFLVLYCSNIFSQEDRYYESIDFKLFNGGGEFVENATILIDGKIIPYDTSRRCYLLLDTVKMFFDVEVSCEGYDTLRNSRENIEGFGSSHFSGILRLKRPTEKIYYVNNWLKMPYEPHQNKLLVILNSREYPHDDSLRIRLKDKIKQQGLKINDTFIKPPTDPTEIWRYQSYVGLDDRIIIEKEDGSNFENDYCAELSYLRSLEEVEVARPVIRFGKYNIITYDHKISLYQFGTNIHSEHSKMRSKEIKQKVSQVDERFYFDEHTWEIVLPPETNEIIPEIMEKLRDVGIKERMTMLVYFLISRG